LKTGGAGMDRRSACRYSFVESKSKKWLTRFPNRSAASVALNQPTRERGDAVILLHVD
jgi:hypothetical protein